MPTFQGNIDQKMTAQGIPAGGVPESVRSLAHDLRTPLTSLQSCLNLILAGQAGPVTEDQRHFLGLARRNIDRLDSMVGEMLCTARGSHAEVSLRRREVDLGPLLSEAVTSHALTAAERGLELDSEGIAARFPACVDPQLVLRILDNILGNALKFTPSGGLVRVWLEAGTGTPRSLASRLARRFAVPLATFNLIVEDSGPGLSSAVQSRIFEPYNSGPPGLSASATGTGLGLSITRRLAALHGGGVRLASLPGRGTTVWLKLPRDRASDHFQRTVDRLQSALFDDCGPGPSPLVGVLDLRRTIGAEVPSVGSLDDFFGRSRAGEVLGWESHQGLWVAAVMDPVNWNRRWALYAAGRGGGLEATRWEFLQPGQKAAGAATGHYGKQRETMVNPVHDAPIS